jgi:hypothetical protein
MADDFPRKYLERLPRLFTAEDRRANTQRASGVSPHIAFGNGRAKRNRSPEAETGGHGRE